METDRTISKDDATVLIAAHPSRSELKAGESRDPTSKDAGPYQPKNSHAINDELPNNSTATEVEKNTTEEAALMANKEVEDLEKAISVFKIAKRPRVARYMMFIGLTFFTSSLLAFVAWYTQAIFTRNIPSAADKVIHKIFGADVASTLAGLRLLEALLTTLTSAAFIQAFELIKWTYAMEDAGVNLLELLSISSDTGIWGSTKLVTGRHLKLRVRLWSLTSLTLIAICWLSGVLLFLRTSLVTAYQPINSYNMTAGVGSFNRSYVSQRLNVLREEEPLYPYTIVPYGTLSETYNLVGDTKQVSNVPSISKECQDITCESYLVTAGLQLTTPWTPTGYDDGILINIDSLPAVQVEFQGGLQDNHTFAESECTIYGQDGILIGIRMCFAQSQSLNRSYIAGIYVCTNGTQNDACLISGPVPNITTTFSLYNRTASISVSRSNNTIMSIIDMSIPSPSPEIDVSAFKQALSWLLDFNASATPPPSSIAAFFWSAKDQLGNYEWSSEEYTTLQSLLTFPLWFFQPNNFGNAGLDAKVVVSTLPLEFHVFATINTPYTKLVINNVMFCLFLVLESLILGFVWVVVVWLLFYKTRMLKLSSFPMADFLLKARLLNLDGSDTSSAQVAPGLLEGDDKSVKKICQEIRVAVYKN